jgi:lysophospholipase L1-like esterase
MSALRLGLAALLFALSSALSACLPDVDHDGVREILFIGDSNTHFLPCAYPLQWQGRHDPNVLRAYDEGVLGTTAHWWLDGKVLLDRMSRDQPDAVVVALGTNDVGQLIEPSDVVRDLLDLYNQAEYAHLRGYVATVPPVYDPESLDPDKNTLLNDSIRDVNIMLRALLPPGRVVDFDSWMPAEWTAGIMTTNLQGVRDGIHLGCEGHRIRADFIDGLL